MACQSFNMQNTLARQVIDAKFSVLSKAATISYRRQEWGKIILSRGGVACSAIQESSTASAVTEVKKEDEVAKAAATPTPAEKATPQKSQKPNAKPLPEMMEEEVIPALKETLEAQEDITDIEISFQDNRVCPKGFSLSSYGSGVSTVEPFLIDEKRITGKQVVFWVSKRLAAQGIIPVWSE
ncbi:hypothetical protein ZIOFF_003657 [Zingiber officinale]|uniref:Uncharacterized protein n=1 Tax=Zingiber officinale TaxID=94328 RepID=A0A8J5LWU0_ZINOF|nr:hypothetical protein ZIOFF_003657 [Zingiber officinale]